MSSRQLPRYIATALVCTLLAIVIYRAKTQSFTIDEAFAFNLYVDRSLDQFLLVYDACNHVLHTLLTKFVRYWLGTSELVLRLISLVGALLYLIVVRRLCRITTGSGWTHVIGIAALGFNPLILDFLVAARGYGLALALFLWSIYYSVRWLNEGREVALLWRAGLAAGLSIAANLTLLVPAAALGATLLLLATRGGAQSVWNVIDRFGGPAVVVAFLLVVLPLSRSKPENFYLGTKSMNETIASLVGPSFRYERALAALFALLITIALTVLIKRLRSNSPDLTADMFVLSTITLALSVTALIGMNRFLSIPYPYGRTGLYMIPLFILSILGGCALLRPARYAGAGLLAVCAILFASQFNARYFREWRFDASTNRLIDSIVRDNEAHGGQTFTVAGTSLYGETLKYYRKRRKLHRMSPEIITQELDKAVADYFVLVDNDRALVEKRGLRVIMQDYLSGAVVAARS